MSGDETVDVRAFRTALSAFATGVTVVTARARSGEDVGVTANSFNSVSLEPPMILWSLAKQARSLPGFVETDYFAVHVLSASQDALSANFSRSGGDKFKAIPVTRGAGGIPLLEGCVARFQCRKAFVYEGGDHWIIVGQVEAFDHEDRPPLVFHGGSYALAVEKSRQRDVEADGKAADSSFSQDFLVYLIGRAYHQLFAALRRDLQRLRITEDEWFAMSVLGASQNRRIAQLDEMLRYTGRRLTYDLFARLAAAGLVELRGGHDPSTEVYLTERGRAVVVELVAAAKAVEADAERHLGKSETILLKGWLRDVIRDSVSQPEESAGLEAEAE